MNNIELKAGLTIQCDSIAVNINFLNDTEVFVSQRGYGTDLPHNCLGLKRYPQDQFKKKCCWRRSKKEQRYSTPLALTIYQSVTSAEK